MALRIFRAKNVCFSDLMAIFHARLAVSPCHCRAGKIRLRKPFLVILLVMIDKILHILSIINDKISIFASFIIDNYGKGII